MLVTLRRLSQSREVATSLHEYNIHFSEPNIELSVLKARRMVFALSLMKVRT